MSTLDTPQQFCTASPSVHLLMQPILRGLSNYNQVVVRDIPGQPSLLMLSKTAHMRWAFTTSLYDLSLGRKCMYLGRFLPDSVSSSDQCRWWSSRSGRYQFQPLNLVFSLLEREWETFLICPPCTVVGTIGIESIPSLRPKKGFRRA